MSVNLPPYLAKRKPKSFDLWDIERQQAWLDHARRVSNESAKRWKNGNQWWYDEYKARNKEKILGYGRAWAERNPEKVKAKNKRKYWEDPDKHKKRVSEWRSKNKKRRAELEAEKRECPKYRMASNLGRKLRSLLSKRGSGKGGRTISFIGCGVDDLAKHLESKMADGMTWDNYGSVWHIDHIMPISSFDHGNPDHVKRCWHFTNLRPMFAEENISKSNKITEPQYQLGI